MGSVAHGVLPGALASMVPLGLMEFQAIADAVVMEATRATVELAAVAVDPAAEGVMDRVPMVTAEMAATVETVEQTVVSAGLQVVVPAVLMSQAPTVRPYCVLRNKFESCYTISSPTEDA